MEAKRFSDTYVIRLDRGEELVSALTEFCAREGVTLASVTGIGACDRAVVGLYDVEAQEYHKTELTGPLELVSLIGNVTTQNGATYLHLHAAFCGEDAVLRGGHLTECRISATGELTVRTLPGSVERRRDPGLGLNLFRF